LVIAKNTAYCAINALIVAAHEKFEEHQVSLKDTMNDLVVRPALYPGLFKHGHAGQSLSLRISF